jgi:hypothetical protein
MPIAGRVGAYHPFIASVPDTMIESPPAGGAFLRASSMNAVCFAPGFLPAHAVEQPRFNRALVTALSRIGRLKGVVPPCRKSQSGNNIT